MRNLTKVEIGEVYGGRTVVDILPKEAGMARVLVQCECGKHNNVSAYALADGRANRCGSCATSRTWKTGDRSQPEITKGQRFGKRTVLRQSSPCKDGRRFVWARCDCGHEGRVSVDALLRGRSLSCRSCARREAWDRDAYKKQRIPEPGERFGQRVVVRMAEPTAVGFRRALMRCDCGHEGTAVLYNLLVGRSRSCMSCARRAQWRKRSASD